MSINNNKSEASELKCVEESARNIPSGTINVQTNGGWAFGGWGFASPFNSKNYGGELFNWGSGNFGYGNFGDDNQGNQNFGNGNQGDLNLGNFNVGEENCGDYNVGRGNVGNWNVGTNNSGSYNLGIKNIGTGNTGLENHGNINVGRTNIGDNNIGIQNTGDSNLGIQNLGDFNLGYKNSGNSSIGFQNTGDTNVGILNDGNFNLGYLNIGDNNTGAWNYGEGNVGYLAGVKNSTILNDEIEGEIYWMNVKILEIDDLKGINGTGWLNLNSSNVGVSQSGFRNLGYLNVGNFNTGYRLNGTNNTGGFLTGDNLIGIESQVTMEIPSGLLNSSVYGFIEDLIILQYPDIFDEVIKTVSDSANDKVKIQCSTFTPMAILNSFSISFRCRGSIKITDLFCSGDSFKVYKDSKLWFVTPIVSLDSDPQCLKVIDDPEEAFYDEGFSSGMGWVSAGSYRIRVEGLVTRWGGGGIAIKADEFCDRTTAGEYIRF